MKSLRGFTLVEMAIVLVLFGIVASMGLKMVNATLDNSAYSETKAKQERIKIALIGFLRTNGRLPCPDIILDQTSAFYGSQRRVSGADSACTGISGVIPWRDLQLSRSDVTDGWGDFFTYRVANSVKPDPINWTSKTIATPFDINQLVTATNVFTINERNGGTVNQITPTAVVVIISHGKNGLGAHTVKGTTNTAPPPGTDEATNATPSSSIFYRSPYNEVPTATGGIYDDILAYMTPQDLLQPLVTEGTLKACVAYCPPLTSTCSADGKCSCTALGASGVPAPCAAGTCTACALTVSNCSATGIPIGNSTANCP